MAVVAYTEREEAGVIYVTWEPAASGDTFEPYRKKDGKTLVDIFFAATGTFGWGSLEMHGSDNAVDYQAGADVTDAAVALTAAGHKALRDAPIFFKPVLSGSGAGGIVARLTYRYLV